MTVDPILALRSLGYTEREASFLYLVGVHSGYFLRRQFDYFTDRRKGYIAHHFIEKVRVAGHVEVIDYGQGRFVYHLIAKPIYRLLGNAESQNRRRKGDGSIRARLMLLDYVLENNDDQYLETPSAKLQFLTKDRNIPAAYLASKAGRMLEFLEAFPVALDDPEHPGSSLVRFAFLDEGLLSTAKFVRYLDELTPLLHAVRVFEVIYVATARHNFSEAEAIFQRRFARPRQQRQQAFDSSRASSSGQRGVAPARIEPSFVTLLFHYHYPRLMRNEALRSVCKSGGESDPTGSTDQKQRTSEDGRTTGG
jgi:hypothetical protein